MNVALDSGYCMCHELNLSGKFSEMDVNRGMCYDCVMETFLNILVSYPKLKTWKCINRELTEF